MTLDIRGSCKNTKINTNHFIFLDELFSNAIDSYLIRKNNIQSPSDFECKIKIEIFPIGTDNNKYDLRVSCTDNGAGLGDEQTKAFVTKDTSFKDDLSIVGIGRCKGAGRVQFFHYFSKIKIDSTYDDNGSLKNRLLDVDHNQKEIDNSSFKVTLSPNAKIETTFTLDALKPDAYKKAMDGKNIPEEFSALSVKYHLLVFFLQRLIGLSDQLGNFKLEIKSVFGDSDSVESLVKDDLPSVTSVKNVDVNYFNHVGLIEKFKISHYKLDKDSFNLNGNSIVLCAKSSAVKFITKRYLKSKTIENNPIDGHYHLVLVESDFLDVNVNEQRDDFDIPVSAPTPDELFQSALSLEEIYESIDDVIYEMISPPDWDKDRIIDNVEEIFGISREMIIDSKIKVHYGDTEENVAKRVLSVYQEKMIKDTSEIFDIKQQISSMEPQSDDFRIKINEFAWKYTSTIKSIDMASLSQTVIRRAAVLEVLDIAIKNNLLVQSSKNKDRSENEKIIHNIFFPMQTDSELSKDHDIWILNEEYQYYEYIASDIPLAKYRYENQSVFDSDIDDKLNDIFEKNYSENSKKRPDIAIFGSEGAVIIIEFKAPGVSMDDHVGDLMEYSQLIAAKSKGKLKKFYGYLIGTEVNPNRLIGYTKFPDGKGWFNTVGIMEHNSNIQLGQLYSEILYYDNVVDKARKRLAVYKNRLKIDI